MNSGSGPGAQPHPRQNNKGHHRHRLHRRHQRAQHFLHQPEAGGKRRQRHRGGAGERKAPQNVRRGRAHRPPKGGGERQLAQPCQGLQRRGQQQLPWGYAAARAMLLPCQSSSHTHTAQGRSAPLLRAVVEVIARQLAAHGLRRLLRQNV